MMTPYLTLEQIDQAADAVRKRTSHRPRVGIILGSGLNDLADSVQKADVIPYADLPNWPVSTVHGHAGRLVIGELEGQIVFIMQGRIHFYEGYGMSQITLPVRVMQQLGLEIMIVTNAAGGISPDFAPGDVMLI
jgi:purine-nucleoside phosphorylase